jgi:hypothetical protein
MLIIHFILKIEIFNYINSTRNNSMNLNSLIIVLYIKIFATKGKTCISVVFYKYFRIL